MWGEGEGGGGVGAESTRRESESVGVKAQTAKAKGSRLVEDGWTSWDSMDRRFQVSAENGQARIVGSKEISKTLGMNQPG